jgi:hypothetical protein
LFRSAEAHRLWLRRLGFASRGAHARLVGIYRELGLDPAGCRPRWMLRDYVLDFADAAGAACAAAGRSFWLEKTPDHVRRVDQIARWLPGSRFLHILRNGHDNICSLMEITRQHRSWSPRPWTLQECRDRWTEDVQCSLRCAGRANHLLIRHADLVADPQTVVRSATRFLGLEVHPAQFSGVAAERVSIPLESWKNTVSGGVTPQDPEKYRHLLSATDRSTLLDDISALQARIDALPGAG